MTTNQHPGSDEETATSAMSLASLTPDPRNARRHTPRNVGMIVDALHEVGAARSIVIDEDDLILAGNATVEAAAQAGIERVRVIEADGNELIAVKRSGLTPAQKRRLALFDNRTAELADWDPEILATLQEDPDLSGLWSDDELAALLASEPDPVLGLTDPDEVPEPPTEPVTQPGDLWLLGPHHLLCGDATVQADVERVMEGQAAGMIFTDPPYGVDYQGKTKDALTIANDDLADDHFTTFLHDAFRSIWQVAGPGAAIYVCHADSRGLLVRQVFADAGWQLRQCLIWVKPAFVLGRQDYQWRHEPILYGWKEGAAHYFINDRTQSTVWDYDKPSRSAEHPTMKPVALVALAIANSSRPSDLVLDPFGGSGSTLIACEQLGRCCRLLELDPSYCDVIVERWERFTGTQAVRVERGGDEAALAVSLARSQDATECHRI